MPMVPSFVCWSNLLVDQKEGAQKQGVPGHLGHQSFIWHVNLSQKKKKRAGKLVNSNHLIGWHGRRG